MSLNISDMAMVNSTASCSHESGFRSPNRAWDHCNNLCKASERCRSSRFYGLCLSQQIHHCRWYSIAHSRQLFVTNTGAHAANGFLVLKLFALFSIAATGLFIGVRGKVTVLDKAANLVGSAIESLQLCQTLL